MRSLYGKAWLRSAKLARRKLFACIVHVKLEVRSHLKKPAINIMRSLTIWFL
ncbi:hypothetical protein [Brunnivagina elsteri]|uniref:hypothetical protein n=1 Tax=Brunnivagina elsteri TaxID=1247191 RepID=UPI0013047829|nr:hypothetical protein [Calothrix elsteri]